MTNIAAMPVLCTWLLEKAMSGIVQYECFKGQKSMLEQQKELKDMGEGSPDNNTAEKPTIAAVIWSLNVMSFLSLRAGQIDSFSL